MPEYRKGEVQLLAKADGIIAGLQVFERVFKLLDEATETKFEVKDGDTVTNGQFLGVITGDIRVLLSGDLACRSLCKYKAFQQTVAGKSVLSVYAVAARLTNRIQVVHRRLGEMINIDTAHKIMLRRTGGRRV